MLPRILEPEVMDSPGDAAAYDSMDHADVNRRFAAEFLAAWGEDVRPAGMPEVLDVGTGTGQIPLEICRQAPALRVLGIDLAASMLELAERRALAAGLAARMRFERVDAKRLPYAEGSFAAVMSNSIVHHVADPASVLAEMVRVAAPGALLFVRDLARPDSVAQLEHLVATYAAGADARQRQLFADSLHAALRIEEVQAIVAAWGFAAATVAASSDRHWTWLARNPAPSARMSLPRYIG